MYKIRSFLPPFCLLSLPSFLSPFLPISLNELTRNNSIRYDTIRRVSLRRIV